MCSRCSESIVHSYCTVAGCGLIPPLSNLYFSLSGRSHDCLDAPERERQDLTILEACIHCARGARVDGWLVFEDRNGSVPQEAGASAGISACVRYRARGRERGVHAMHWKYIRRRLRLFPQGTKCIY